ncbi:MAG: pyridoxine 5'-phosphate synthase [Leptospira sp.]|nr:pyridoxine 5'-phosphate synthase [Leptospira sp.]
MIKLSVNVNKIATLRTSRGENIPNLAEMSELILESGAHGLTVHPRSDERHIRATDVPVLRKLIRSFNKKHGTKREFNIEGAPDKRFLQIILDNHPDQATLVPVSPREITSDHGFNFIKDSKLLGQLIKKLKNDGVRVSLFVDAGVKNLEIAKEIGADRIELYTGPFAKGYDRSPESGKSFFKLFEKTALDAKKNGLEINAGHDLDHRNLILFRELTGLKEVSIGHRLMSYALISGIETAVKTYLKTLAKEI